MRVGEVRFGFGLVCVPGGRKARGEGVVKCIEFGNIGVKRWVSV